jgi:hypothetical protein
LGGVVFLDWEKKVFVMYDADSLIQITEDSLVINDCFFPWISKRIPFEEIIKVQVFEPSLLNGSWRLWGTGTFQTWYAMDGKRPQRDAIFVAHINDSWMNIGFSVESSTDVIRILDKIGIPIVYN